MLYPETSVQVLRYLRTLQQFIWSLFLGVFLAAGIMCAFPSPSMSAIGEVQITGSDPLYIRSESLMYISKHRLFVAEGDVQITYRKSTLSADRVEFNEDTGDAVAIGNVKYEEEGETIIAERTELNFDTELGTIFQGKLALEGDHYITGREIEKTGDDTYVISKGSYSACSGDNPAWSFRCSRANVQQGEYLQAWNTVGYVKGIPVMYFPYFIFPVKTERQSGLLVPEIGTSSTKGFTLTNAYFWAILPSQDATFSHTYYNNIGHRFDLEYRYIYSQETDGTFTGKFFRDSSTQTIERRLEWHHRQQLPYDVKAIVNVNLTSDDQFDEDFETRLDDRTIRQLDSNVSLTKNFSQHTIRLLFDRLDNLQEENADQAKQIFPELQITSQNQKLFGTPLYIAQQTRLSRLEEEGQNAKEFVRLDSQATLTLPITVIDQALTLNPTLKLQETYYSRDAQTASNPDLAANPVHRENYNVSIGVNGPKFNRIFDLGRTYRIQKMKHLVEPTLTFTYQPAIDEVDVPKFDGLDWTQRDRSRILQYGMTQRLLAKRVQAQDWERFQKDDAEVTLDELQTEVKEIATLTLNQAYNFEVERRNFSDISAKITARPLEPYSLTVDTRYDVYVKTFVRTNISARATFWDAWTVGVQWDRTATVDTDTNDVTAIQRFLNLNTQLNLFNSLGLSYRGQFNIESGERINDSVGLTYNAQCWNISANYVQQLIKDERESRFNIRLDLKNLGQLFDIEG